MSLRSLSAPERSAYENVTPGLYVARLVIILDRGLVQTSYGDKHFVYFGYEIMSTVHGEAYTKSDGAPMTVGENFNLSLGKGKGRISDLRNRLGQFEGRQLTDDDCNNIDLSTYLNRPAIISVVNNTTEQGNTFDNVASLTPTQEEAAPARGDVIFFDYESDDPQSLPVWLQNKLGRDPYAPVESNTNPDTSEALPNAIPDFSVA